MARVRGNGSARPGGAWIRVRCPNLECGKSYRVPAEYAGKKARCSECGTHTAIPRVTAGGRRVAPAPSAELRTKPARRPETAPPVGRQVREVRIGSIGRGHAGKTALFHALGESLVGDFLPSGLHLDAADPREVQKSSIELAVRREGQPRRPIELKISAMARRRHGSLGSELYPLDRGLECDPPFAGLSMSERRENCR